MRKVTVDKRGRTIPRDERGLVLPKTFAEHASFIEPLARAVIELDEKGNVVRSEYIPFGWCANYLVVLGPVQTETGMQKAIRLEIGFGRTVPYKGFRFVGTEKRNNTPRKHIPLSAEETLRVFPEIAKLIQSFVDERISKCKGISRIRYEKPGTRKETVLMQGLDVVVSKEEQLLLYALLLQTVRGRKKFLTQMAVYIKSAWKNIKKIEQSLRRLRSYKKIAIVLDKVQGVYTKEQLQVLTTALGVPKHSENALRTKALFEKLWGGIPIKEREPSEYEQYFLRLSEKFSALDKKIISKFSLQVVFNWKLQADRTTQGKGSFHFQILPSKEVMHILEQKSFTNVGSNTEVSSKDDYLGEF